MPLAGGAPAGRTRGLAGHLWSRAPTAPPAAPGLRHRPRPAATPPCTTDPHPAPVAAHARSELRRAKLRETTPTKRATLGPQRLSGDPDPVPRDPHAQALPPPRPMLRWMRAGRLEGHVLSALQAGGAVAAMCPQLLCPLWQLLTPAGTTRCWAEVGGACGKQTLQRVPLIFEKTSKRTGADTARCLPRGPL